jgi:hypothetical protein
MTTSNSTLLLKIRMEDETGNTTNDELYINSCNYIEGNSYTSDTWQHVSIPFRDMALSGNGILYIFQLLTCKAIARVGIVNLGNTSQLFCIYYNTTKCIGSHILMFIL